MTERLYRFSPIFSTDALLAAINYVATQTASMSRTIMGVDFPVMSLTIFAHYPDEFEYLCDVARGMGTQVSENNGPFIGLTEPLAVQGKYIDRLRIRKPDPYRMQVGCNDFEIADYIRFKTEYLILYPNHLRLIPRADYEMIEFFHPDFDVLAYAVSN